MSVIGSPLSPALWWTAASKIYPNRTFQAFKARINLMGICIRTRSELKSLLEQPQHAPLLEEFKKRPEVLGFIQWPYVHADWSLSQRFDALSQHLQAMLTDMRALHVSETGSVEVANLSQVSPDLKLIVDRAPWCLREGSLVFNQFLGDERMMSLSFSFGWRDGERVVYVGSLQGSNVDSALAKYRDIAKNLQGMRSRDFLIKSFQFLMYHLDVKKILCIQDAYRHHRHKYFGSIKSDDLHLNYDDIWLEHAGEPTSDGFYRLRALPIVRPLEEIAAKNRALYRRRYEMMDKLSTDIKTRFFHVQNNSESISFGPNNSSTPVHQPLIQQTP